MVWVCMNRLRRLFHFGLFSKLKMPKAIRKPEVKFKKVSQSICESFAWSYLQKLARRSEDLSVVTSRANV